MRRAGVLGLMPARNKAPAYYLRPSYRLDRRALTQSESFCERGTPCRLRIGVAHARPQEMMLAKGRAALPDAEPIFSRTLAARLQTVM